MDLARGSAWIGPGAPVIWLALDPRRWRGRRRFSGNDGRHD